MTQMPMILPINMLTFIKISHVDMKYNFCVFQIQSEMKDYMDLTGLPY